MDPISPATNEPGMECAIFGDLTKRRCHGSAQGAGPEVGRSRWKAGAGLEGRGGGATRPGTAMTEQERDGARYKGQARSAWLWVQKYVCGRTVPRRPLSAPFEARNGRLCTNAFCLKVL